MLKDTRTIKTPKRNKNNQDTSTESLTSFGCPYYQLKAYPTLFCSASIIVELEHVYIQCYT